MSGSASRPAGEPSPRDPLSPLSAGVKPRSRRANRSFPRERADNGDGDGADDSDFSAVSVDELPSIRVHGHTYHGSGRILVPNDESERQREEIQHELFKLCLDGALAAAALPRHQPLEILDVGCGSGIWACEVGENFPLAHVMGIDVSAALLPREVPRNVSFELEDVGEPWTRPSASLDLVQIRNPLGGGFPAWRFLLEEAYRCLKPGGQIEFAEMRTQWFPFDDADQLGTTAMVPGPSMDKFRNGLEYLTTLSDVVRQLDVDFDPVPKIAFLMCEVGFEKVRERSDLVPCQPWGNLDEKSRRKGMLYSQLLSIGE